MTISAARCGILLVAKRASDALSYGATARTAGILTRLYHVANLSTTTVVHPSVRALLCKPRAPFRVYSDSTGPEMLHRPSNFDRKILVWSKTYPSLGDIPEAVPHAKMKKAKDVFRIRVNIWMGVWTVIGCIVMIYWGRKSAREGNSLEKENMLWHQQINEQAKNKKV
ncbi:UPF0389 protein CG9231-like [Liolophura sinensis]|uniref:UPF0389 protein CG9231-like n=1 Tax=Liolophura sinensis TaxID=3198878 RepID=UPI0031590A99